MTTLQNSIGLTFFLSFFATKFQYVSGFGISPSILEKVAFMPQKTIVQSSVDLNSLLQETLSETGKTLLLNGNNPQSVSNSILTSSSNILLGDNILLPLYNPSSVAGQVGDGVRSIVFGIFALIGLFFVSNILVLMFVLPKQAQDAADKLKEEYPEKYAKIEAQLNDGETIMDRPDLFMEVLENSMQAFMEADEEETKKTIEMIQQSLEDGSFDAEEMRPSIEEGLGMNIEFFIELKELAEEKKGEVTGVDEELYQILKPLYKK
mmetsp:Transcript_10369/g.14634  ORF Transcript_10369/g.14634 Transcript_10369/m.14634 type:complete len:264 (-) Transcript_10369:150-941(-)